MSLHGMYMHEISNEYYFAEKLYPDHDEERRCGIAAALGFPLIPLVTEKAMIRYRCNTCFHKFKVLGRVAMSGIFGCPKCKLEQ